MKFLTLFRGWLASLFAPVLTYVEFAFASVATPTSDDVLTRTDIAHVGMTEWSPLNGSAFVAFEKRAGLHDLFVGGRFTQGESPAAL